MIKRFIDCYMDTNVETKYDAGSIVQVDDGYAVGYAQLGAERTFSIGQPVYDKDHNLMGYLGIGLFHHLNYATEDMRIPSEVWVVLMPTKYCEEGKKVFTYWQNKKAETEVEDGNAN